MFLSLFSVFNLYLFFLPLDWRLDEWKVAEYPKTLPVPSHGSSSFPKNIP